MPRFGFFSKPLNVIAKSLILLGFIGYLLSLSACEKSPTKPNNQHNFLSFDTIKAWDITTYAAWGDTPQIFYDSIGKEIDLLAFAKTVGVNTFRVRILTGNPIYPHATVKQLLDLAQKARQHNIAIWLDFHYSDVWADPGNQSTPTRWLNLTLPILMDSIHAYTYGIVQQFTQQGTEPSIVQIGNEITPGMLWPLGKFNGKMEEANLVSALFNAGATGAKKAAPNTQIMLHLAGNDQTISWIANSYLDANFNFDIWGFSYYGFWHGCETQNFMKTCESISQKNQKPFVIAETAHPFTLNWLDQCHNSIGNSNQLCKDYPAHPNQQWQWLKHIWTNAKSNTGFKGMAYWEPTWVTNPNYTCNQQLGGGGSSWENLCLFDFNHRALPAAYFNWQ